MAWQPLSECVWHLLHSTVRPRLSKPSPHTCTHTLCPLTPPTHAHTHYVHSPPPTHAHTHYVHSPPPHMHTHTVSTPPPHTCTQDPIQLTLESMTVFPGYHFTKNSQLLPLESVCMYTASNNISTQCIVMSMSPGDSIVQLL